MADSPTNQCVTTAGEHFIDDQGNMVVVGTVVDEESSLPALQVPVPEPAAEVLTASTTHTSNRIDQQKDPCGRCREIAEFVFTCSMGLIACGCVFIILMFIMALLFFRG